MELNHHRRYQITVGRDLLGDRTVSICYGRSGQGGQMKRFASSQADRGTGDHSRPATPTPQRPEADRMSLPADHI